MKVTRYTSTLNGTLIPFEVTPAGSDAGNSLFVTMKEKPLHQPLTGFGAAITGSSCFVLNEMPPQQRDEYIHQVYGKDGLHLSVARLSMAASDYSAELYSYDDGQPDPSLEHFTIERDEAYILPMIREILKVNPDLYLYSSPWTPPAWMKTGGSLCGGYMRDRYVESYAQYFVRFLKAYAKQGVPVKAVTAQNEPETDALSLMPSCRWNPDTEALFLKALDKQLKAEGMDTKLWLFDHNFDGWCRVRWMLQEYPELLDICDAAAFHYYEFSAEKLDKLKEAFPQINLHLTEGGPRLFDNYATDHCKWGLVIANAINHGCGSFCGWNLILDEDGGPCVGPFFCGGLATYNRITRELTYSGQYRALAHFTKFMQPGAEIYPVNVEGDGMRMFAYPKVDKPLVACAAENPDGTRVLVIVNANDVRKQAQCFYEDQWWYFDLMSDSLSTIVFEK